MQKNASAPKICGRILISIFCEAYQEDLKARENQGFIDLMPKIKEQDKLLNEKEEEDKARRRTRGPYRKAKIERPIKRA
ncbi:MAG: hypothetical protein ACRECH_14825 [Nitrososphaerales archaeon]